MTERDTHNERGVKGETDRKREGERDRLGERKEGRAGEREDREGEWEREKEKEREKRETVSFGLISGTQAISYSRPRRERWRGRWKRE